MQEISITARETSKKLENFLKKLFPIGYVRKLFRKNGVRLNGRRSKPHDLIAPGDCIQLYIPFEEIPPSGRKNATLHADLNIIFEDDKIIVLNKPAGIAVHEGKSILKQYSLLGMLEADIVLRELGHGWFTASIKTLPACSSPRKTNPPLVNWKVCLPMEPSRKSIYAC